MTDTIQIQSMSREEKLQVMEALWEDLSSDEAALESPSWHHKALKQTEARVAAGQEQILDWPMSKKELRKRFE